MGRVKTTTGFTLIELMIALAILVIVTVLAISSYQGYVERARLTNGTEVLSGLRLRMEQSYSDNRTYRAVGSEACAIANFNTDQFAFTCVAADDRSYLWTATNLADVGMGAAGDYVYNTDEASVQQTLSFKGTDYSPGQAGWIVRKSQIT